VIETLVKRLDRAGSNSNPIFAGSNFGLISQPIYCQWCPMSGCKRLTNTGVDIGTAGAVQYAAGLA
jgi:hypothetical protein